MKEARDYIRRKDDILRQEEAPATLERGQRIEHFIFGKGTVLDVDMNKKAHIVQFDDMDTPRAISFRAKLEKI